MLRNSDPKCPLDAHPARQPPEFGEPFDSQLRALVAEGLTIEMQAKIACLTWEFSPVGRRHQAAHLGAALMASLRAVPQSGGCSTD